MTSTPKIATGTINISASATPEDMAERIASSIAKATRLAFGGDGEPAETECPGEDCEACARRERIMAALALDADDEDEAPKGDEAPADNEDDEPILPLEAHQRIDALYHAREIVSERGRSSVAAVLRVARYIVEGTDA